ncbi:hypothetical protein G6F68_019276 [Rhizopus microsporus]|nr:hypothetical protein G6F68_019276 [Rhizopus microsporus]
MNSSDTSFTDSTVSSTKNASTQLLAINAMMRWRRGEPLSARISIRIWWLRTKATLPPAIVSTISRNTEISSVQAKDWSVK